MIAQLSGSVPVVQAGPVPQVPDSPQASGNYPDPEKCTGVCDWIHDPNIVYDRGLYWRFVTSNNITIATAPSLEGPWTNEGPLLTNGTAIHLRDDQDIWVSHTLPSRHTVLIRSLGALNFPSRWSLVLPLLRFLHRRPTIRNRRRHLLQNPRPQRLDRPRLHRLAARQLQSHRPIRLLGPER